jgi:hypothetical protein
MAQRTVRTGVELDRDTDADLEKWADSEGRSKRRHAAIVLRKLTGLLKTHPSDLERLGLTAGKPTSN